MGIELKLSDRDLPASPAFILFLYRILSGETGGLEYWPDQRSEQLVPEKPEDRALLAEVAECVMNDARGRECVARAYTLFVALLTGDTASLATIHSHFQFVNVVGVPRTGGSYLTAEIFRALEIDPHRVPGALAHDSFPEAGPFALGPGFNTWTVTLKATAEYLAMVEFFFAGTRVRKSKVIVPKKLTQVVYAAGLFRQVFGTDADFILTIRHPVAACVSTYEKSGGLPADGRFRVRSNIERWCRRDLEHVGWRGQQIDTTDYFQAYLRYWELYHLRVATSGLSGCAGLRIVPYGAAQLQLLAQDYHVRYGSGLQASTFEVSDKARRRHPDWIDAARPSVERVRSAWSAVGLGFPIEAIDRCE